MIIQNPLLTGSLSYNGADLSNVTSSNANSASVSLILTAVSSSNQQLSASYIALSASYNVFSGSASTRITTVSSSQQDISASLLQVSASYIALSGSYNTFSGSASTRVTKIENNYATTGSNSFRADQSITGSLVVSSTITAQTLVVQTVTSSILYSSGSNIFGNQLANTQTFTGSVNITGSLALAGNITGNAITLTGALSGTSATFSGNVGIGMNPLSQLMVYGASETSNEVDGLRIRRNSIGADIRDLSININSGIVNFKTINNSGGKIGYKWLLKDSASEIEAMRLDASGNLGLGVTPSAWSQITAIELSNGVSFGAYNAAAAPNMYITSNAYYNGTNWIYKLSSYAPTLYVQNSLGNYVWHTAPSGTAGNAITLTAAMTFFNTGNLVIGTTTDSGYKLDVNGTGRFSGALTADRVLTVNNTANSTLVAGSIEIQSYALNNSWIGDNVYFDGVGFKARNTGYTSQIYFQTTGAMVFLTSPSTVTAGSASNTVARLSIASTGAATFSSQVGIGTAPNTVHLDVQNTQTGTMYPVAAFRDNSTNGNALQIQVGNGEARLRAVYYSAVTAMAMTFWTGNSSGAEAERMRITGDGNVGIGATTINSLLSLNSTAVYYIDFQQSGTSKGLIGVPFSANQLVGGSASGDLVIRNTSRNTIFTNDSGNTAALYITSTNNVLIGTTTDDTVNKLQVAGSGVFSSSLKVSDMIFTTTAQVSVPNSTATTVYTMSEGQGIGLLTISPASGGTTNAAYTAICSIGMIDSNPNLLNATLGTANITVTRSGANIQVTHAIGSSTTFNVTYLSLQN